MDDLFIRVAQRQRVVFLLDSYVMSGVITEELKKTTLFILKRRDPSWHKSIGGLENMDCANVLLGCMNDHQRRRERAMSECKRVLVCVTNMRDFTNFGKQLEVPIIKWNRASGVIETKDRVYHAVTMVEQMRGYHGTDVEFFGPWADNKHYSEFLEQAIVVRLP